MIRQHALILILLTFTACYSPGDNFQSDLGGHNETGRPALHAIHDKNLRELMDRMDTLMQERILSEPERDIERIKYAQRVAINAERLAQTVDNIIGKLPSLQLPSDEQHAFQALANKLREQSLQLHKQAQSNQIDALDETMNQINTTCTSCHALFRKSGG